MTSQMKNHKNVSGVNNTQNSETDHKGLWTKHPKSFKKNATKLLVALFIVATIVGVLAYMALTSDNLEEQELIIGMNNDAISLDPSTTTDLESFQVSSNIFETLVKTDINGIDLLPGLAHSWDVSEDGLTFVFKLREGVVFHDNTPFNAEAVVFNFDRWRDKDSPYHTGQFTYWNQSFGGDPGMIMSVTALSDDTVEIVLNEPYTPFLNVLSMPPFAIASPNAIITYNGNLMNHPVGTGSYQLESWKKAEMDRVDSKQVDDEILETGEVVLSRNPSYWQELGPISKVTFRTLKDQEDHMALLESGEIHIVNPIDAKDILITEALEDVDVRYLPFLNISYLALNHNKAPFDKVEVRRAIALAIDNSRLIKDSFDLLSRPANSFLPPILDGYDGGFKSIGTNITEAKSLLESAGYANGFDTTLWVMDKPRNYYPNPEQTALNLQEQLLTIGVRAKIVTVEWSDYIEKLRLGEHDMALSGWQGDFVDPDNFLFTMFYSDNTDEGTVLNYSYYSNDQVDESLRKARRVADSDFRAFIYREIQETLLEEMASVPLAHRMTAIGVNKSVHGFNPSISGMFEIRTMDIEGDGVEQ